MPRSLLRGCSIFRSIEAGDSISGKAVCPFGYPGAGVELRSSCQSRRSRIQATMAAGMGKSHGRGEKRRRSSALGRSRDHPSGHRGSVQPAISLYQGSDSDRQGGRSDAAHHRGEKSGEVSGGSLLRRGGRESLLRFYARRRPRPDRTGAAAARGRARFEKARRTASRASTGGADGRQKKNRVRPIEMCAPHTKKGTANKRRWGGISRRGVKRNQHERQEWAVSYKFFASGEGHQGFHQRVFVARRE